MLLVYTHKITPRLTYIFKHIFVRILKTPLSFTTKVEEFVAHNGPKITYTKAPLGTEFFIRSHSLLFEQGIGEVAISMGKWEDVPCFFATGEQSTIPFDIFAASFYLITRYEEYHPHVSDRFERFDAVNSLAYQHGFLEKPVIDIWAFKLLKKLQEKYPDYSFDTRSYQFISTINVNDAFAYKHKGFIRNLGGFFTDFIRFDFKSFARRTLVLLRIKDDPFATYDTLVSLGKNYLVKTVFFFLFSEYTTYDKNISYSNTDYRLLIKSIIDYAPFGQLFSYYTVKNTQKLNKEKKRLEEVVNRPITKSRQHFNRIELPKTYQNLIDLGITEEYSMGYYSTCGFRASTCTPFYFYDLDYEIQTPLKVFSFVVMDETLQNAMKLTAKEAFLKIKSLQYEVQQVHGTFISIFHNATLSDRKDSEEWRALYEKILKY